MRRILCTATLAACILMLLPTVSAGQTSLLLNPSGAVTFDSPDHAKAASYTVGWFKLATDAAPAVAETVLVANVTGVGPYTLQTKTRPPFAKYVLKVKVTGVAPCDPGFCESPWSDPGTWTKDGVNGSDIGYTPANPRNFLIK